MKAFKILIIILLAFLLLTSFACIRNPRPSNVAFLSSEKNLKSGQIKWKLKKKTGSISNLKVDHNSIYFFDERPVVGGDDYLYSIDKRTGKFNWKFKGDEKAGEVSNFDEYFIGNKFVYLINNKRIIAIDKSTGRSKWIYRRTAKPYNGREEDFRKNLVANDFIYFEDYLKKDGRLVKVILSIDGKTGKITWRLLIKPTRINSESNEENAAPSSILDLQKDKIFINEGLTGKSVTLLKVDAKTGKEKRRYKFELKEGNRYDFDFSDNLAFLEENLTKNISITAINLDSGRAVWKNSNLPEVGELANNLSFHTGIYSDLLRQQVIINLNGSSYLHSLDTKNGFEKWKFRLDDDSQLAANSDFNIKNAIGYFTGGGALFALDMKTGKEKWRFGKGEVRLISIGSKIAYLHDNEFSSGTIYAIDALTGKRIWRISLGNNIINFDSSTISNNFLYAGVIDFPYDPEAINDPPPDGEEETPPEHYSIWALQL